MRGSLFSTGFTGKRNGRTYYDGCVVKKWVKGKDPVIDEIIERELKRMKELGK